MSTVIEQADAFRRYVAEQSQNGGSRLTLDELFKRWQATNLSDEALADSLQSLERGLADAESGRLVDAEEAIANTRSRLKQ